HRTLKVLSSGATKGRADSVENGGSVIIDRLRIGDPPGFWTDYEFRLVDDEGTVIDRCRVTESDGSSGRLSLERALTGSVAGARYELVSGEEAPIVAIRTALG